MNEKIRANAYAAFGALSTYGTGSQRDSFLEQVYYLSLNNQSPPKFDLMSFSLAHNFRYSFKFDQFWLHHNVPYPTSQSQEWSLTMMFWLCCLHHIRVKGHFIFNCCFFIKGSIFITIDNMIHFSLIAVPHVYLLNHEITRSIHIFAGSC